jgi:hypothetical protein
VSEDRTPDRSVEDVLVELESQVTAFAAVMAVGDDLLWREPTVGEWSAATVIVHMSDAEVHVAARLRYLLTEESPAFPGWGEEEHAALSSTRSPEIALAVIAAVRASNADLIGRVSPAQLQRTAVLPDGELVDVVGLLDRHARHTANHLEQAQAAIRSGR